MEIIFSLALHRAKVLYRMDKMQRNVPTLQDNGDPLLTAAIILSTMYGVNLCGHPTFIISANCRVLINWFLPAFWRNNCLMYSLLRCYKSRNKMHQSKADRWIQSVKNHVEVFIFESMHILIRNWKCSVYRCTKWNCKRFWGHESSGWII